MRQSYAHAHWVIKRILIHSTTQSPHAVNYSVVNLRLALLPSRFCDQLISPSSLSAELRHSPQYARQTWKRTFTIVFLFRNVLLPAEFWPPLNGRPLKGRGMRMKLKSVAMSAAEEREIPTSQGRFLGEQPLFLPTPKDSPVSFKRL